jgi:phage major head subunit gpT-like protein
MFNSAQLLQKVNSRFLRLMQVDYKPVFDFMIDRVTSKTDKEIYPIMQTLPGFSEFLTGIEYGDWGDNTLTVYNKIFADGISVNRFYLENTQDYIGNALESYIKTIVEIYKNEPDRFVKNLFSANATHYDGTAFFATSRPNIDTGSNTIDNLATGTLSSAYTTTTFGSDFQLALNKFGGMLDKLDNPLNPTRKYVALVPTQHMGVAKQVLTLQSYIDAATSDPTSAVHQGMATIVENTYQSLSDHDWYLINVNNATKPVVIQDRDPVKWYVKDEQDDPHVKFYAKYAMGASFLNPFSIVKINN